MMNLSFSAPDQSVWIWEGLHEALGLTDIRYEHIKHDLAYILKCDQDIFEKGQPMEHNITFPANKIGLH